MGIENFLSSQCSLIVHPKAHKLTSEPKNRPKRANFVKIGGPHRSVACPGQKTPAHSPSGPENTSPQRTQARKRRPVAQLAKKMARK